MINHQVVPLSRHKYCRYFLSSKNADDLWQRLKDLLAEHGVTMVFYGVNHMHAALTMQPLRNGCFYLSSYPNYFIRYIDERYHDKKTPCELHCINYPSPQIWHRDSCWRDDVEATYLPTDMLKVNVLRRAYHGGNAVGVTIPLRFENESIACLCLSFSKFSYDEFDQIWAKEKCELILIANTFNRVAHALNYETDGQDFTRREQQIVRRLSDGCSAKIIAQELGTSVSTVENQIVAARQKLAAKNTVHLVTKALEMELV